MADGLRAIVPFVGGLSLIGGGMTVLYVDRCDLLADPLAPRPIYLRYASQATFDLYQRPHWIFVSTMIIFGPCLIVTALCQAQCAREPTLAFDLRVCSTVCATCGFWVAILPIGNALGFALHSITAQAFAGSGIYYVFLVKQLALERNQNGLVVIRSILSIMGSGLAIAMLATVYGAAKATIRIEHHRRILKELSLSYKEKHQSSSNAPPPWSLPPDFMSDDELRFARRNELFLSASQVLIGFTIGIALLTSMEEVAHLNVVFDDKDIPPLIIGFGTFVTLVVVALIFVQINDVMYNFCQRHRAEQYEKKQII